MLLVNVTAGIGVLSQASPMSQDFFPVRITAVIAGGFVGLLSIANMSGRFVWSTFSDYIGRKATYLVFFTLGPLMYILIPLSGRTRECGAVRVLLLRDSHDVRRRIRDDSGVSARSLRHAAGGRHPRPPAHRVVDGRRARTRARELHRQVSDGSRRAEGASVRSHALHHGGAAADRPDLRSDGATGRRALPRHRKFRIRARCGYSPKRRSVHVADDVRLQSASASSKAENSDKLLVILAWTFVLVPLAWGVTQTVIKSVAIFR